MSGAESNSVTAPPLSVGVADEQRLSLDQFDDEHFLPVYDHLRGAYALTPEACQEKLDCTAPIDHCCFLSDKSKAPLKAYTVTYDRNTEHFKCSYQGISSVRVRPKGQGRFGVEKGAFQTGFAYELNEDGETQEEPQHNETLWTFKVTQSGQTLTGIHSPPCPVSGAGDNDTLYLACAQSCSHYNSSGYDLVKWEAAIEDGCRPNIDERDGSAIYERCQESVYLRTYIDKNSRYGWDPKTREALCVWERDGRLEWVISKQPTSTHTNPS